MAYIGKAHGFSQRLLDGTDSPYCLDEATNCSQRVVKSPVKLSWLREDIRSYDGPSPSRPVDEKLDAAIKLAYDAFTLPSPINPIHLNDFPRAEWDKWHTSPGLPWKNLGFKDKFSVAKDIRNYRWVRCYWHKIKDGKRKPPFDCDAYLDSFPAEKDQAKVIWGYAATSAFQEACFAIPLNRECKKLIFPLMYDNENIKDELKNIYTKFEKGNNFLSFEYEKFEKTAPAWVIRIAFDILLKNLDLTKYADRGIPEPDKLLNAWKYVVYYFINTTIRLCNGERYRKRKGIPNGSSFAQLIGSMVNYIITTYALLKSGNEIKEILVCGSSTLISTSSPVNIEEFVNCITKCGLKVGISNTESGSDINKLKFLGFRINTKEAEEDIIVDNQVQNCECSSSPVITKDQDTSADSSGQNPLPSCSVTTKNWNGSKKSYYPSSFDCKYDGVDPCHHGASGIYTGPSSYPYNYYDYMTNTNFDADLNGFMYYFPFVAEANCVPHYGMPLFMSSSLQY